MTNDIDVGEPPIDPIGQIIFVLAEVLGFVFTAPAGGAFAIGELFRQQGLYEKRPTLLLPNEAIEAFRREEMSEGEFHNTLARTGYSDRAIGVFSDLKRALLSVGDLTALLRREEISEGAFFESLKEHGIDGEDARRIHELAWEAAGPQDVIRFVVREVFNGELRAGLGLDAEFPTGAIKAFKKAGLSEELARDYWAAHWELPSISLAFEMFHRKEIAESDIDLILKAGDVLPRFREPIKAVAFKVLTRVDLRRMHALGLLDSDELQSRYEDLGYSPDNAALMVKFTEAFNDRPEDTVGTEIRDLTRSQITQFLEQGLYEPDRAVSELQEIGFGTQDAETIVALTSIKVLDRQRKADIKIVQRRFDNQTITFDEAVSELDTLDLTATERDLLLAGFEAERQSQIKTPSRAELDKFAKNNIITIAEYEDRLIQIGYSPMWASRFVELINVPDDEG